MSFYGGKKYFYGGECYDRTPAEPCPEGWRWYENIRPDYTGPDYTPVELVAYWTRRS